MSERRAAAGQRQPFEGRSPDELRRMFHLFGRVEAPQVDSPLYAELSYGVSDDAELLALAAGTRAGQPPPNMLYAAVQYLLLRGADHPLAAHYPAVSGADRPFEPAFPLFRDFCLRHRDAILPLLETRRTQTNVIQRCVCLLPAFALVAAETRRPLYLVEVGTSAGLNLNWDRYRYVYPGASGDAAAVEWGPREATVRLTTQRRGPEPLPELPPEIPVARRIGIDLNPIHPSDADAVLWLRALIFPEHVERHARLLAALEVARAYPPPLLRGDAVEELPRQLGGAAGDVAPVVFATHALYQIPRERRRELLRGLQARATAADGRVDFIGLEGTGPDYSELTLTTYEPQGRRSRLLANANPHGRWLEWLPVEA